MVSTVEHELPQMNMLSMIPEGKKIENIEQQFNSMAKCINVQASIINSALKLIVILQGEIEFITEKIKDEEVI